MTILELIYSTFRETLRNNVLSISIPLPVPSSQFLLFTIQFWLLISDFWLNISYKKTFFTTHSPTSFRLLVPFCRSYGSVILFYLQITQFFFAINYFPQMLCFGAEQENKWIWATLTFEKRFFQNNFLFPNFWRAPRDFLSGYPPGSFLHLSGT